MKYAQIIKIQNNIQKNSDITSAGSKDTCQVDTCQTCDVQSLSAWTSKKETYRADFGSNDRFVVVPVFLFVENGFFARIFFS